MHAGIMTIGCAFVSAYGLAGYIGLLFTPLMSVLPFLMLGLGVDGIFILQAALNATNREDPMELRMGTTMLKGGVSVVIAALANFGGCMIGANTFLPAVSAFCIYAAIVIILNLILQVRVL
jgi:Niemann-Pick C1 protein